MFCLNPDDLPLYRDMGANFICVASDVVSLRATLLDRVKAARANLSMDG